MQRCRKVQHAIVEKRSREVSLRGSNGSNGIFFQW